MTAPLWLLTVEYDKCDGTYQRERQSLHSTRDAAVMRLFDVVYAVADAEPADTLFVTSVTREDGAEFADLDALGEDVSYSLVPMVVDAPAGQELHSVAGDVVTCAGCGARNDLLDCAVGGCWNCAANLDAQATNPYPVDSDNVTVGAGIPSVDLDRLIAATRVMGFDAQAAV